MLKYFGTDGVRGVANADLTSMMAYRIGRFLGQSNSERRNRILVCEDTRVSGEMLKSALLSGLLASGAEVYDDGVSTTPSVSFLVEKKHFDYGVMISASHNPFGDNGIKVFNRLGEKLEDEVEEKIEEYMDRPVDDLPHPTGSSLGRLYNGTRLRSDYLDWLSSKRVASYEGLHVLVDCANGSASYLAPRLYKKIGLNATFINASPDGTNINEKCGSTHLDCLKKRFSKGGFDLAFAFDGDGDRFMALAPDGRIIDGDAMIFLNALSMRSHGLLHHNRVVLTVMSNFGLRKALTHEGVDFVTVPVGDKNVQAELKKEQLSLGGEQSGHVIFLDDLNTGDGLLSSLKLLNLFVMERSLCQKLSEFVVYPQVLENISFSSRKELENIINNKELLSLEKKEESALGEKGRILIRMSGTEPLLRVMAEAETTVAAQKAVSDIVTFVQKEQ